MGQGQSQNLCSGVWRPDLLATEGHKKIINSILGIQWPPMLPPHKPQGKGSPLRPSTASALALKMGTDALTSINGSKTKCFSSHRNLKNEDDGFLQMSKSAPERLRCNRNTLNLVSQAQN